VRERYCPLTREKKLAGKGPVTRGAQIAAPGLEVLNRSLPQDMPKIRNYVQAQAQMALNAAVSNAPEPAALSDQFIKDYNRNGVYLDGKFCRPESGVSPGAFTPLFRDPYDARMLSQLATQNLDGIFYNAMYTDSPEMRVLELNSQKRNPDFMAQTIMNTALLNPQNAMTARSIEVLDAQEGRYRISTYHAKVSDDDESAVERLLYEMSLDVCLGPPNGNPRPPPVVENVRVDYMLRGREASPGEGI
ncbi:MAG: hypothetical protein FWG74_04210, partial [Planctomycetes bacterium]|nr:hypothetical protein [Planctomycetota bacterium]